MKTKIIVSAIRMCDTREELDDVFNRFEIKDNFIKYEILLKAIFSPEVSYTTLKEVPDLDDKLTILYEVFLFKDWKMNLYNKLASDVFNSEFDNSETVEEMKRKSMKSV